MKNNPLAVLPLFQDLSPTTIEEIYRHSRQAEYPDGEVLFLEGQPVDCIHILLEGSVEILKALGSENEQRIALRHAGDSLGEMSLYQQEHVRSASGRAVGRVCALEISLEEMDAVVRSHPPVALRLVREISQRLRDSESRLVHELRQRNEALEQALLDLQQAQEQLVEQEKMEHELKMARGIQQSLLPEAIPCLPGWEIQAVWQPARAVGGDFYDFIRFADGHLGLVIGDVTGKGVPAALVMATMRSVLHAVTGAVLDPAQTPPGEILSQVNNILCLDMPKFMFVTCLLVLLDPQTGTIRLGNAGHVLPTRIGPQGLSELRVVGMPLGLFPDLVYDSIHAQLEPGDSLFLLSDGLIEAHNPDNEMFGSERLQMHLGRCYEQAAAGAQAFIPYMLSELYSFTGEGWEQEDDLTFVTVSRNWAV